MSALPPAKRRARLNTCRSRPVSARCTRCRCYNVHRSKVCACVQKVAGASSDRWDHGAPTGPRGPPWSRGQCLCFCVTLLSQDQPPEHKWTFTFLNDEPDLPEHEVQEPEDMHNKGKPCLIQIKTRPGHCDDGWTRTRRKAANRETLSCDHALSAREVRPCWRGRRHGLRVCDAAHLQIPRARGQLLQKRCRSI